MRHWLFRVSLLLFMVVWFGAIVPGHRRGQIAPAGWNRSCCNVVNKSECPARPSPACAVCEYTAMLDVAPPVQIDVPPLGLACFLESLSPAPIDTAEVRPVCQERAPPVA